MLVVADGICADASMVFLDEERGRRAELLALLREQLGDRFAALRHAAEQLSRKEMIELALAD
jgi:hypothetical protein